MAKTRTTVVIDEDTLNEIRVKIDTSRVKSFNGLVNELLLDWLYNEPTLEEVAEDKVLEATKKLELAVRELNQLRQPETKGISYFNQ